MFAETPDTTPDGQLVEAARRFLGEFEVVGPVGNANHLLRVASGNEHYVIHRWPESATAVQANLASRALSVAAGTSGGALPRPRALPDGADQWSVELDGRRYTASTWIEGRPLARYGDFRLPDGNVIDVPLPASAPAEPVILQAVRVVAGFHTASASLAEVAPAGDATLHRLQERARRAWSAQRRVVGQEAGAVPEIRRWLRCGNRVLPVASEHLEKFGGLRTGTVVAHTDLWPANLLIEGEAAARRLTGVVGWSSVAVGSPLVDLAHLVVHMSSWSGATAENVLGAYTEHAVVSPAERRLLPVVAALDLVPRVGTLLHLAYLDERMVGHDGLPVLRSGLKALLVSLENLTEILAPQAEWSQRKFGETRRSREGAPRTARPKGTTPGRRSGSGRSRPGSPPRTPKRG